MAEGAASHHWEEELKARSVTDIFCVGTAGFKTCGFLGVVQNIGQGGSRLEHHIKVVEKVGFANTTFEDSYP